jgi:hypothetical protein
MIEVTGVPQTADLAHRQLTARRAALSPWRGSMMLNPWIASAQSEMPCSQSSAHAIRWTLKAVGSESAEAGAQLLRRYPGRAGRPARTPL